MSPLNLNRAVLTPHGWVCLSCARVVEPARVVDALAVLDVHGPFRDGLPRVETFYYSPAQFPDMQRVGQRGRITMLPFRTGHESLCCGGGA